MEITLGTISTLTPNRFISFPVTNRFEQHYDYISHTDRLRFSVLDSPIVGNAPPSAAAIIVPRGLESDWLYTTHQGLLQIIHAHPEYSRLFIVSVNPVEIRTRVYRHVVISSEDRCGIEKELTPLLEHLCSFPPHSPPLKFLRYKHDVEVGSIIAVVNGSRVGGILVEDVRIRGEFHTIRRLRFCRSPNNIQTQMRVFPTFPIEEASGLISSLDGNELPEVITQTQLPENFRTRHMTVDVDLEEHKWPEPDTSVLGFSYLKAMIAGLSLISLVLNAKVLQKSRPRVLCLGVGGGALVSFLSGNLDFSVLGVDIDDVVITMAKEYFGLAESNNLRLIIEDGLRFMENLAQEEDAIRQKFDSIMVDLDSSDANTAFTSPCKVFVSQSVLDSSKLLLLDSGILIVNVICPDFSFYSTLVQALKSVFAEVYKIHVSNVNNRCIVIAVPSPVGNSFLTSFANAIIEYPIVKI